MKKVIILLALVSMAVFAQEKGSFTDARDKKTYKTVKIGEQVWFAENLNYNAKGSECYDNKESNCNKYGRLYDWETEKTVCPSGWHLPSDEEWEALKNAVGGFEIAEKFLKSKSGWNDDKDFNNTSIKISGNGNDKFGFTALPGGTYGYNSECGGECGGFRSAGLCAFFGSASEIMNSGYQNTICSGSGTYSQGAWKDFLPFLFSVRCLQD